jgi:hypothetical protein
MKKVSGLTSLILSAGIALSSVGCASWPKAVKIAATPVAAVRDVVDIPFASGATFFNYVADNSGNSFGKTSSQSGYGWNSDNGWGPSLGMSVDITSPVCRLLSYTLAAPDYLVSRSLCGSLKGKSPFKKSEELSIFRKEVETQTWGEFLFPNLNELWAEE